MKWIVALLAVFFLAGTARADGCTRSREYIMDGFAGELLAPPVRYRELFKVCVETLSLTNVKDAYLLRDGGIAIVPKRDSVIETAETLAQFCRQFPKNTARFITAREQKHWRTIGLVVLLSSTGSASCKKIRGFT